MTGTYHALFMEAVQKFRLVRFLHLQTALAVEMNTNILTETTNCITSLGTLDKASNPSSSMK